MNTDEDKNNQIIKDFSVPVGALLNDFGLKSATHEQKRKFIEMISKRVSVAVTRVVMENMPEDKIEEFRKAVMANNESKMEEITQEAVKNDPDLQVKIKKSLDELYQAMKKENNKFRERSE